MAHRRGIPQLSNLLSSQKPSEIAAEARRIFHYHYPASHYSPVSRALKIVLSLFAGKFPGYRACNTEYHNLSHTMDVLLATARIVDGFNIQNPPLPSGLVANLFRAALLHDVGYLQEFWDTEGTGAKYTSTHVERGVDFIKKNREAFGFNDESIRVIENTIRCTKSDADLDAIPFASEIEKYAGFILGSADILGQMSDRAYLEKLLFLYYEFKEAGIAGFDTEFDLLRKTAEFYRITKKRLSESYQNVHIHALNHFKHRHETNSNMYVEAIERQIAYLEKIIEDESTNFRHKLKRGAWVHEYRPDEGPPAGDRRPV